ncbi:MAG: hypothetical protein KZQ90_03255 [Candidatus Thiodiazotropha sp. (ex Codakia rugifera)]|nr:hypothetical protein [Candidatus Thiodiazotropha sp. (ex Codakia rugifera)]
MDYLALFVLSREERDDYYRTEIMEHTPPLSTHDKGRVQLYQRLLDINQSTNQRRFLFSQPCNKDVYHPLSRSRFIKLASRYMIMGNLF